MKRYNKITGVRNNKLVAMKGPWTAEEDRKIISLVQANGAKKWSQIAAELPGKSKQSRASGTRIWTDSEAICLTLTTLLYFRSNR